MGIEFWVFAAVSIVLTTLVMGAMAAIVGYSLGKREIEEVAKMIKFNTRKADNIAFLALKGNLSFDGLSGGELSEIGDTIKREINNLESSKVIIDLSGVSKVDSSVIGFLVLIYKRVVLRNGAIVFIHPGDEGIRNKLHELGLTKVFRFHESEDVAIMAMQSKQEPGIPPTFFLNECSRNATIS